MRLSLTPMQVRRPAPLQDQHRAEILAELESITPHSNAPIMTDDRVRKPMLEGLRMADLTQQYAGPLGTAILAYYGMEVVKIESTVVPSKDRETAAHADMNRAIGCTPAWAAPPASLQQVVAVSGLVVENFRSGFWAARVQFDALGRSTSHRASRDARLQTNRPLNLDAGLLYSTGISGFRLSQLIADRNTYQSPGLIQWARVTDPGVLAH
jgi:hypothetical protein